MSAEDASNGAAQQQQQLAEDAGIPQLPGAPSGSEGGPHGDSGAHEGPSPQGASSYGDAAGYQQHQQQQQGETGGQSGMTEEERTARKIFVGGLNRNTTAESLKEYFSAFGPVHHTEVLFDKLTGRSRGFGFVTFEDVETINSVVDRHHTIDESQRQRWTDSLGDWGGALRGGPRCTSQQQQPQQQQQQQVQQRGREVESFKPSELEDAACSSSSSSSCQALCPVAPSPLELRARGVLVIIRCSLSACLRVEKVEVRRAIPREEARQTQPRRDRDFTENSGRVFIGGLGDEVTDDVLKEFFSRFGELTSANVMVDRETNRPRGFGFVIYKNPDDAEKALGIHKDLGPNAEAKRAQPRSQGQRMRMGMGMGMGMAAPYRVEDPRFAMARGVRGYEHMGGYGGAGGAPPQMYGGYNYAYNPYYAAYYAQVAAAYGGSGGYGGGYGQSPTDGAGADRGGARMPSNPAAACAAAAVANVGTACAGTATPPFPCGHPSLRSSNSKRQRLLLLLLSLFVVAADGALPTGDALAVSEHRTWPFMLLLYPPCVAPPQQQQLQQQLGCSRRDTRESAYLLSLGTIESGFPLAVTADGMDLVFPSAA
ncbi:hypothetical protein Efla_005258 [Eimeria flavescens]